MNNNKDNVLCFICLDYNFQCKFEKNYFKMFNMSENLEFDCLNNLFFNRIINDEYINKKYSLEFNKFINQEIDELQINDLFLNHPEGILCLNICFDKIQINNENYFILNVINNTNLIKDKLVLDLIANKKNKLLKTVLHRIKNNLQVINSLIILQKRFNKPIEEILDSTQSSIFSIALLYESLYQKNNNGNILISRLLDNFGRIITEFHSQHEITFKKEQTEDFEISLYNASTLFILVNELIQHSITNSLANITDKKITISIDIENNECIFIYKDNGSFISDTKEKGFEEIIIESLVKQLQGSLEIQPSTNYSIKLKFPLN